MPNPTIAVAGISAGASLIGANQSSRAARDASAAQQESAQLGIEAQTAASQATIEEQRRQFDAVQELLNPFVQGGTDAFAQQLSLVGSNGAGAQRQAISAIEQGPEFQALMQQGENAILQNASATGGLRGGNTQAALAQYRPQVLSGLINQQYERLGGLSAIGQNSAAGVGAAGQNMASNIGATNTATAGAVSNLFGQQGSAAAGSALAQGAAFNQGLSGVANAAGNVFGQLNPTMPEGAGIFSQWGF